MSIDLRIDFVSDISCPWCAIGLNSLSQALERVAPQIRAALHFQPFELNPQMPPGGQDIGEHIFEKYGSTPDKQLQGRAAIRERGAQVGFVFEMNSRDRIYNTFDAHRLLHWADLEGAPGQQEALKRALFAAYFTRGESPESLEVLVRVAASVGLNRERALAVLAGDEFAAAVRQAERQFLDADIHSVPTIIINGQYQITGGQSVDVFERALRKIADKLQV
jgi:predicted DsbA family dithiol-disulfide isomerase